MKTLALLISVSLSIGFLRFHITSEPITTMGIYKDLAHCFVGGLWGAWFATKHKTYLVFAGSLTILEIIAFFMTHKF